MCGASQTQGGESTRGGVRPGACEARGGDRQCQDGQCQDRPCQDGALGMRAARRARARATAPARSCARGSRRPRGRRTPGRAGTSCPRCTWFARGGGACDAEALPSLRCHLSPSAVSPEALPSLRSHLSPLCRLSAAGRGRRHRVKGWGHGQVLRRHRRRLSRGTLPPGQSLWAKPATAGGRRKIAARKVFPRRHFNLARVLEAWREWYDRERS